MEVMLLVLIAGWVLLFGFYIGNRLVDIETKLEEIRIEEHEKR